MNATAQRVQQSRFSRKPRQKEGKPRGCKLTARDLEKVLPALVRYRLLDTDYLYALAGEGGDRQSFVKHLGLLYANGKYINRPDQQRKNANAYYRHVIYERDVAGAEALAKQGIKVPPLIQYRNFEHKYLECLFEASIELGTRERPNVSRIEWPTILVSDKFPEERRKDHDPISLTLPEEKKIKPDGMPFVLAYQEEGLFRFCVYEADCDTESGRSTYENSLQVKIEHWLTVIDQKLYRSQYGANTFVLLFVATTPRRQSEILEITAEAIKAKGYPIEHARRIGVTHTPIFTSLERPAPASGFMLTQGWKRACGYPDLYLDRS